MGDRVAQARSPFPKEEKCGCGLVDGRGEEYQYPDDEEGKAQGLEVHLAGGHGVFLFENGEGLFRHIDR